MNDVSGGSASGGRGGLPPVNKAAARKLRSLATAIRAEEYAPHDFGVREEMEVQAVRLTARADELDPSKPAIEEPLAFGSVVRAANGVLYVRVGAVQALPWATGEALRYWDQFDAVEVLRVGVGDEAAYNNGVSDTVSTLVARLLEKRHGTNLMQKRDAFTEAIKIAEALS